MELPRKSSIVTKMRVIRFGEGERGSWRDQLCHEGAKKEWGKRVSYRKKV